MDGVHTHCRSRGADGLAFVLQGERPTALGRGGMVSSKVKYITRTTSRGRDRVFRRYAFVLVILVS